MTLIPGIKQISQVGNDMYIQGAFPVGIGTTEVSYLADPADTRLLAGRDPVLEEVSVGMSGVETDTKYAAGAQPLTVTDAMMGNLTYCGVQFSPKQDLHGYANPWPAGGGANQWDEDWEAGRYNPNTGEPTAEPGIRCKNFIPVVDGQSYYLYCGSQVTNDFRILYYDDNKTLLSTSPWITPNAVITLTAASYIKFYVATAYGSVYKNDIAINYPSTVTTYSPYSNLCPISGTDTVNVYVAESYDPAAAPEATVSLGAERFGGTAEIVSGTGSEGYAEADLGELNWSLHNNTASRQAWYTASLTFKPAIDGNHAIDAYCDIAKVVSYNATWTPYVVSTNTATTGTGLIFCVEPSKYADATEFAAAMSGVKLVYPLATPTPYTFPGANDITLQDGTNTIWADTNGPDISVTYVTKK